MCLWAVSVWGFVVLFWSCACVSGVLFSVGVCVCDLLIFLQGANSVWVADAPRSKISGDRGGL